MASFLGTASNDTFGGGNDDDTLQGLQGDDQLFGQGGQDTIEGGEGADYLAGGDGDDLVDGGAGQDIAAFYIPDIPGTLRLVQGAGADAGALIVELVDGSNVQAVFRIELTPQGAVVTGLGVAAGQGTDTVVDVEELHFLPSAPFDPSRFLPVSLAPAVYTDPNQPNFAHVAGSVRDDVLDLSAMVPQADATWQLNADGGALGADTIIGHDGPSWVRGNGGDDSLSGGGGDDYQVGDAGDDVIDGGDGRDTVGYELPVGASGTLQAVAGTGADAGKQLIQLVNGGSVETVLVITQTSPGAFTVQGVNSAAWLGADTVSNTENLHVYVGTPDGSPPSVQLSVELLASAWIYEPNHHVGVNGTNFGETIDIAAYHQDKDATWTRFVNGFGGDDSLVGSGLGEQLFGGDGDDTVSGQDGDDHLNGDAGNDRLIGGEGYDTAGFELLPGFTGELRTAPGPTAGTLYVVRVDGAVTENLFLITQTGSGEFTVQGLGAYAAQGTDVLSGVEALSFYLPNTPVGIWIPIAANPWEYDPNHHIGVDGSPFNDLIDLNLFHTDKDASWGRFSNAGNGDDTVIGTPFDEMFHGQDGDDSLSGEGGADRMYGGRGADTLSGGAGDDVIILADANTAVPRENGADVIDGGDGFDIVSFWSVPTPVTVNLFNLGPQDTGFGVLTFSGVEGLEGGRAGDDLQGDDNGNWLSGGFGDAPTGNDVLSGNGGDDILLGRDGDDYLIGGAGDDIVVGGPGRDIAAFHLPPGTAGTLRLVQGQGADAGYFFVERVDGAQVEQVFRIQYNGPGAAIVSGLGSASSQGTDTVQTTEELHFLVPQDPFNPAQFLSVNLAPTVWTDPNGAKQAHVTGSIGGDVINLGLAVPAAQSDPAWNVNANGGFGDDTVVGTGGSNYIRGDDGADSLSGGGGDDNLIGDGGDDVLDGGAGFDSASYELPAGTTGALQWVQGQGADAGKVLVQLVDGASIETVFAITKSASGSFTVEGRGSASGFGTDTLSNIEGLNVYVAAPDGAPPASLWLNLTPNAWVYEPNHDVGVDGTAFADAIDLSAYHTDKDATWGRFVNAGGGDDSVVGTAFNDGLNGDGGDDTLNGGDGDDYIRGGPGNDVIDGGAGANDIVAYNFAPGTPGTYAQVEGQGVDAGKLFIERTANGVTERIFEITFSGSGASQVVTVRGLGSAADFGTDQIRGVEQLHFLTDPFNPAAFVAVNLTPYIPPAAPGAFVNGSAAPDVIDLAALYPSLGAGDFVGANGNAGGDSISGHAGPNLMNGGTGDDTLSGLGGDDQLRGDDGDDVLLGGAGNDLLRGNAGVDYYDGGEGFDRVSFYDLRATQGVVADLASGVIINDGFGNAETMVSIEGLGAGTRFVDYLAGDDGDNVILGGWRDVLLGRGGDDTFQVGGAPTLIDGGSGVDTVYFTSSRTVDANNDGIGDEEATTSGVWADLGLQQVINDGFGESGALLSIENLGGTDYNDTLVGDGGNNELAGFGGDDSLVGGDGADTLYGGAGNDQIVGGAGADQAVFSGARSNYQIDVLADGSVRVTDLRPGSPDGVDILRGVETLAFADQAIPAPVFNPVLMGTEGDDTLVGGAGDDTIVGLGGFDSLVGLGGNDSIDGGAGSDYLRGEDGNDTLAAGSGDDYLSGGAGDDRLDGGAGLDRVSYYGAPGGVRVNLGVTTAQDTGWGVDTLVNIEHVSGTDFGDTLTGNAGANWLWSTGGADSMNGQAGNDLISIGPGDSTVSGGAGVDTLSFYGNGNAYASGVTVTLGATGAQSTGHGTIYVSSVENLSGSIHADTLSGDGLDNILAGHAGDDVLNGGAGNDTLTGDGAIEINTSGTGGSGFIDIQLNPAAGSLPQGNDVLNGGAGDDWLIGGGGNDTLNGGAGIDTAVFRGARSGYSVLKTADGYRVTDVDLSDGDDGTDLLTGVERIQFADTLMSLGQTVGFAQSTLSRAEGAQGTTTVFAYTVNRSGDVSAALDVTYTIRGSGADPADAGDIVGFNGVSMSGVVHFAAGQTTATISVPVAGDRTVENNEGFTVTLAQPTGADVTFSNQIATGTILNDDSAAQILLPPGSGRFVGGFGDPHLTTLDGLQYDMQGVGEFVLLESTSGSPVSVQIRTEAVNDYASEITALAAKVGDARVMVEAEGNVLRINGAIVTLPASGIQQLAGGGSVSAYAADGASGWVISYPDAAQTTIVVLDRGDRLDVSVLVDPARAGQFRGLLGDFDGSSANDLALRSGEHLTGAPTLGEFYSFADSWRISQPESLFSYGAGQGTATFQDLAFRPGLVTLADFPAELVSAANAAADAAGLAAGAARDAAIRDYLMTGDSSYFASAAGASTNAQVISVTGSPDAAVRVGVGSTNATKFEGSGDGASYAFTIYRSSGEGVLAVNWNVAGAVFDGVERGVDAADFGGVLPSGTVTFAEGETQVTVVVNVSGDLDFEGDEGFVFQIMQPPGTSLIAGSVQGRVLNDDAPPPPAGGNGDDVIIGSDRGETIDGGNGSDLIDGAGGDDRLLGGNGSDTLVGGAGRDELKGENGNDLLDGGQGADTLEGGNGTDTLIGGAGDDVLTGGNGADRFVFGAGFGHDRITDFDKTDVIQFQAGTFDDFADVQAHATQVGKDVVITDDDGSTLTLLGVKLSSLGAGDFLFG